MYKDKSTKIRRKKSDVVLIISLAFMFSMVANIENILQGNLISAIFVILMMSVATFLFLDREPINR